jgi:hypothetical protein
VSAASRNKDKEMASYMKDHPGRYPDSFMRPWNGNGAFHRDLARQMGAVPNNSSKWFNSMRAGLALARLGLGSAGVPSELLADREAA